MARKLQIYIKLIILKKITPATFLKILKGLHGANRASGTPLPIPNREVKPRTADDTAIKCGKVGKRQNIKFRFIVFLKDYEPFFIYFFLEFL